MVQLKKQKTGIFSGSFNPIHIGHLALANYLCEYEGLDEIWFMVSPQNPLKTKAELWSDELRLQLVELSISDYPRFRASDFEFHLSMSVLHVIRAHIRIFTQAIRNHHFGQFGHDFTHIHIVNTDNRRTIKWQAAGECHKRLF